MAYGNTKLLFDRSEHASVVLSPCAVCRYNVYAFAARGLKCGLRELSVSDSHASGAYRSGRVGASVVGLFHCEPSRAHRYRRVALIAVGASAVCRERSGATIALYFFQHTRAAVRVRSLCPRYRSTTVQYLRDGTEKTEITEAAFVFTCNKHHDCVVRIGFHI